MSPRLYICETVTQNEAMCHQDTILKAHTCGIQATGVQNGYDNGRIILSCNLHTLKVN